MILFRPEHVAPILERRKIETRRLGKPRWKIGSIHQARTKMLDRSSTFALLEIGGVEGQALQDIQLAEVWNEGYEDIAEFAAVWEKINGAGSWAKNPMVWAVKFRLLGSGCIPPSEATKRLYEHFKACGIDLFPSRFLSGPATVKVTLVDDPDQCPGEGRCHGPMNWCDRCGDVDDVCDDTGCDRHRPEDEASP